MPIPTITVGSPNLPLTLQDLKALFETGDKPSSAEFCALIEACYGTDQILQFNAITGELGISTSDGSGFNTVNIGTMLNSNLSFTYDDTTRMMSVIVNGVPTLLGPLDGLWKDEGGGDISRVSGNVGIGTSNPSAKLDVVGTTELNGALDVNGSSAFSGQIHAQNNVLIDGNLKFNNNANVIDRISTSTSLAGNSNTAIPTEKAVKKYVDDSILNNEFHLKLDPLTITTTNAYVDVPVLPAGSSQFYEGNFQFGLNAKFNGVTKQRDVFVAPAAGRYLFELSIHLSNTVPPPTYCPVLGNFVWTYYNGGTGNLGWKGQFDFVHTQYHWGNYTYYAWIEIKMGWNDAVWLRLNNVSHQLEVRGGYFNCKRLPDN